MASLTFGNNRQHMATCAKMISSQVRKVLSIVKIDMSLDTLQDAAASKTLVACVSLVFILQAGAWARVSSLARHNFSTYITTSDWHQDSMSCAVLGLSGSQTVGKCQTLTCIKSCGYVGLLDHSPPHY